LGAVTATVKRLEQDRDAESVTPDGPPSPTT
jgi:hypothetical protein